MSWDVVSINLKVSGPITGIKKYLKNGYLPFIRNTDVITVYRNAGDYPIRPAGENYLGGAGYAVNGVYYHGKINIYPWTTRAIGSVGIAGIKVSDLGASIGSNVILYKFSDSSGAVYTMRLSISASALRIYTTRTGGRFEISYDFDRTWNGTYSDDMLDTVYIHPVYLKASDINFLRYFGVEQTNPDCFAFGYMVSVAGSYKSDSSGRYLNLAVYDPVTSTMGTGVLNELTTFNSEVSPEYGLPSETGGYTGGTFDDSSDTISIPTMPTIGISTAGFTNVYQVSTGELIGFGAELFPKMPDFDTSANSIPDVLNNIGVAVQSLFTAFQNSKLIDYVIDCHIIPVSPTTSAAENIKVAYKSFTQTAAKVTSDYVDIDCGSLNVGEYYASFMDYGQFTTAKLYLPFVGFVPIQPEYWQSGVLSVVYRFNIIDGSFVAFIKSTSSKSNLSDSVIAQYGGNCCVHLPVTGLNYANMVSGALQTVPAVINSAKGGDISGAASNALNTLSLAPSMQSSNGYNSCTAFLGVRTPYLIIERAVSNFSQKFPVENGLPSNITTDFDTLTGYTIATAEIMTGFGDATEDEKTMILNALAEGTIF
jgi:hypothetical protein